MEPVPKNFQRLGSWASPFYLVLEAMDKRAGRWRVSPDREDWNPAMIAPTPPKWQLKPSRLLDPVYVWRLLHQIDQHRSETCGARLESLREQISELYPGGTRIHVPVGKRDAERGNSFRVIRYEPKNRTLGDRSFTPDVFQVDWLSRRDFEGLSDLERLSLVGLHVDLGEEYLLAYDRVKEWWMKYHQLWSIFKMIVIKHLPPCGMQRGEGQMAVVEIDDAKLYFAQEDQGWGLMFVETQDKEIIRLSFGNKAQESTGGQS
jgi:hypothetical protein